MDRPSAAAFALLLSPASGGSVLAQVLLRTSECIRQRQAAADDVLSWCCPHSCTLRADQLYNTIGVALTSSANFFINYVVFQVIHLTLT